MWVVPSSRGPDKKNPEEEDDSVLVGSMDYLPTDLIYPVTDADSFAGTRTKLFQFPKLVTSMGRMGR